MTTEKQIPVTEERKERLQKLKKPGQTYDELLNELIQEHERHQLAERAHMVRQGNSGELTSLDEL